MDYGSMNIEDAIQDHVDNFDERKKKVMKLLVKKLKTPNSESETQKKVNGYVCDICCKSFPTFQGLGGHRSIHNKEKNNAINMAESKSSDYAIADDDATLRGLLMEASNDEVQNEEDASSSQCLGPKILDFDMNMLPDMAKIKNPQIPKTQNLELQTRIGVSTNSETKVPLNLRESKIDVEVVHKMGFSANPCDRSGRTYKHRSDKEPAPDNQTEPNPHTPQPSEFHAQSSSSAVMPSNKMIMDELHSLRGYITNQMDALDSQNQQIQYELHCLSSKLRSMKVDEDSSEPES
ncbi:unnamed protein product [Lupinus luteus]|uniref:C2H2-type domain-containing protein n=1 Tax=Lupinus luteus TaxID=3873 RepID=A0AAV1VQW0_LUPLU